jgi:hypothetical protein
MYIFNKASIEDAENIALTTQYYYNNFNDNVGFLAGFRIPEKVIQCIDNYYTVKVNGDYAGHVNISFDLPDEFEILEWYNKQDYINLKTAKDVIYIIHIAIKKEYAMKGCGKFLYNNLFNSFNTHLILSSVIVKPYKNEYSYNFHKKCGFRDIAYNKNDIIGDIHFESIYMLKEME